VLRTCLRLILLTILPAISVAADPPPQPGTVLITGSDRGIGFALAQEFESRGWHVIATCRDPARAIELNAFAKGHPEVILEKLDVADNESIDALVVKLNHRPIDALVNNAGVSGSFEGQALGKLDPDEFERVLRVPHTSALLFARSPPFQRCPGIRQWPTPSTSHSLRRTLRKSVARMCSSSTSAGAREPRGSGL
jgi:NAD(P)-dependent dehydrogenase (short-subunit alcohol dehydrogenase family)